VGHRHGGEEAEPVGLALDQIGGIVVEVTRERGRVGRALRNVVAGTDTGSTAAAMSTSAMVCNEPSGTSRMPLCRNNVSSRAGSCGMRFDA
jgi:hypothetical protein